MNIYIAEEIKDSREVANKIFTTFTEKEHLQETIDAILDNYTILYKKVFVLKSTATEEYICTYNVDHNNISETRVINNTLLLHRNKEHNVLFSINAINLLNEMTTGRSSGNFDIDWSKYAKSILLTRKGIFTQIPTEIHDIIHTN